MAGRDLFSRCRNIIIWVSKILTIFPRGVRKVLFRGCRNIPGSFGIALRYVLLKTIAKSIGDNVSIREHVVIISPENLCVGNNVSIHPYSYIDASGTVTIGNDVSIATHSILISETHTWEDETLPIKYNPLKPTPINIGDDVWIACDVKIIGPCNVESRVIIAAGAVVKGDIATRQIVGGVPAKMIKSI